MVRPTRQEIDDEIVDRAAELFARHGVDQTSVQRIADAVGYSKTGLLHRFPTKEALRAAVVDRCTAQVVQVRDAVADTPPGPARDRAALDLLARTALDRPGFIALLLASLSAEGEGPPPHPLDDVAGVLGQVFGTDLDPPGGGAPDERAVRLVAALGGLAVAALACRGAGGGVRPALVRAACGALGHPEPTPHDHHQNPAHR
ncbi:TetR/AcrR family transcriptional regulator [Kineococcus sp. SYSU DK004]|uniref:TetR/AcrR family transcriptional regulator n=1 Tax=Kineococcus sp. SYSU DK004 TaxID=3383125 RepID=UPI003D7EB101